MWKNIRIFILLVILALVFQQSYFDKRDLEWKHNFYVAVYPINVDNDALVSTYIKSLKREDFEPVVEYFSEEAERYDLPIRHPIEIQLGEPVNNIPPPPPLIASKLNAIVWSLRFRWFAWFNAPKVNVKPDIKLYLLYHNPRDYPVLTHSTALDKGRIGRVNLYGDNSHAKQNLVILAHELLHTLSATDKYDLSTNLPIYPEGYADVSREPLYPQDFAELMAGRLPIAEDKAIIPNSLDQTLIGGKTAHEIGWLK
jgi:hypothetical protein